MLDKCQICSQFKPEARDCLVCDIFINLKKSIQTQVLTEDIKLYLKNIGN